MPPLQLGHLEKWFADAEGNALIGLTVEVRKQGAWSNGTSGGGDSTAYVAHNAGAIVTGDDCVIETGTAEQSATVNSKTSVTLGGVGLTWTDRQRLSPTTNLPTLYSDGQVIDAVANPVTTDARGSISVYLTRGYYDLLVSGTGYTTTLIKDFYVPSNISAGDVRYADDFAAFSTTDGIQEAIDDLPATGGVVMLSSKSYNLDSATITISGDDIVLQGSGWGSVITTDDATGFTLITITGDRCEVRDLKVLSSRSKTVGGGIGSTGDDTRVVNCCIQDTPDNAIFFLTNTRCVAERCKIISPGDAGSVTAQSILFSSSTYGKALDNYCDGTNSDAIGPSGQAQIFFFSTSTHGLARGNTVIASENGIRTDLTSDHCRICDNHISNSETNGIRATGDDLIVRGNKIQGCGNSSIKSDGGNRVMIADNECSDGGNKGIQLTNISGNCIDFIISNNLVNGAADAGIQVGTLTGTFARITIVGNHVYNSVGAGITGLISTGAVSQMVVKGNTVIGSGSDGIIIDGGTQTQTVVRGNTCLNNAGDGIDVGDADAASTIQVDGNDSIGNIGAQYRLSAVNWTYEGNYHRNLDITPAAGVFAVTGDGVYSVGGTADITSITAAPRDTVIILKFGNTAATNGVVDGSNLILTGGVDFAYTVNSILVLVSDGTNWIEMTRSLP